MNDRPVQLAERRVRVSRVADVVADRIRDLIVSGQLGDGDRLPHLDVLVEEFGVSAPSMREALRILENQLEVTRLINRDYSRFDQIGLKVGDTLHVRLPMRWEAKRIGPDRKTLETVEMVITDRYPR